MSKYNIDSMKTAAKNMMFVALGEDSVDLKVLRLALSIYEAMVGLETPPSAQAAGK